MRRTILVTTAVAAAAIGLSACGSNVDMSKQGLSQSSAVSDTTSTDTGSDTAVTDDSGDSSGADSVVTDDSATSGTDTSDSSSSSDSATSDPTTAATPAADPTTPSTTHSGSSTTTKPVAKPYRTTGKVKIGVIYIKPAGAGLGAIGADGVPVENQIAYAKAAVADVNARGGLGGRTVDPVYFGYNVDPGQNIPSQDALACALFTQDNKVEAVIGSGGYDFVSCIAAHKIPQIMEGSASATLQSTFDKYPTLVQLGGMNMDRRAVAEVAALKRQNYWSKWSMTGGPGSAPVKTGVVTYRQSEFLNSAKGTLTNEIKAAGGGTPDVVTLPYHNSFDDIASEQTALAAAVLRFKAAGVTHVVFWDDNGLQGMFFTAVAESQNYRPRYAINSSSNILTLITAKLAGASQLTGAVGVAWRPAGDTLESAALATTERKTCEAMMKKAGATLAGAVTQSALEYCGEWNAVKWTYDNMTTPYSSSEFMKTLNTIGTFHGTIVPTSYISASHHDGAAIVYDYAYNTACSCLKYVSKGIALAH